MTAPLLLFAFALLIGTAGPRLVRRTSWAERSPRLGILVWQAMSVSVVASVVLAGLALALPVMPVANSLADLLRACALALRQHYGTPGGAAVAITGGVLASVVLGRVIYCGLANWISARRRGRTHRHGLALVSGRDDTLGATVITHAAPAVYCLPGRTGEIVMTSGAVAALSDRQIEAVLAHERAHLAERHDLVVGAARTLRTAFGFVPLFGLALTELERLVEMRADDVARGAHEPHALATALVKLAESTVPVGTLGAGGTAALTRIHRLTRSAQPLGLTRAILGMGLTAVLVVIPLAIAIAPALAATLLDYCPAGFPT